MMGLLILQGFWLKQAFDVEERQFNHSIQVAMKNIADSIAEEDKRLEGTKPKIRQLSSNFFMAELNTSLPPEMLDSLIKKALAIREIRAEYELGIYNAEDDTLVYGEYIPATIQWQIDHANDPISAVGQRSNFAIYFPNKFSLIAGEIKIWIFSTIVLLLMLAFFIYAMLTLLKERRLSEIKEDFINNLTHEFKTPIANIELASETLKLSKTNSEKRDKYLNIIRDENKRLKAQVERILQLGAIDKNELRLDLTKINMHDMIAQLAESISMRIKEKTGKLSLSLNASDHSVLADEFHLTNTVYNVLDNAAKYSTAVPDISVSTRNERQGLLISIRDAGIGIKDEFQKHVFEKFFRVPTGDVHNVKGFGLGLSYVKMIVEAHDGQVSLQSQPGQGSQFDIYLPLK